MRALLFAVLAAAGIGAVLYATGVFDAGQPPTEEGTPRGSPPIVDPTTTPPSNPGQLTGASPSERPPILSPAMREHHSILVLAPRPESWNELVRLAIEDMPALKYRTWYTEARVALGEEGAGSGPGRGLPEFDAPPSAATLEELQIDAVLVDRIDPAALPAPFWAALAEGVADGRIGLWVRMELPRPFAKPEPGEDGAFPAPPTTHAIFSHPLVADLLPVIEPIPVTGTPVPGVARGGRPPRVTEAGVAHPASRLVPWERWSRHWWDAVTAGEHGWKVEFTYPVASLRPGAVVLVQASDQAGTWLPAFVASGGKGRVLWQGFFDLGRPAYFNSNSHRHMSYWIQQALAWIVADNEA